MPALLLLLRVKRFLIPLPWFLLWLFLAPFALLGWLVGNTGLIFFPGSRTLKLLAESWRAVLLLMSLHGTEVRVDSADANVLVKFI